MNDRFDPERAFKDFVQVGVVVRDVKASAKTLEDVFGIGPFRFFDWPSADRKNLKRSYREKFEGFCAKMAFTEIGSIELELIQPTEGRSAWADFLAEHGPGIHHIRFNVEQYEPVVEYLKARGVEVTQWGEGIRPGTRWANLETESLVGFGIEIMKKLPGTSGKTPQLNEVHGGSLRETDPAP